jgi:RimJ/RimL family protein N-acetyltransferase
MTAPSILTERLKLRPHQLSDFDAYAGFWAGARAKPFGGPFSRAEAWDSFAADAGQWPLRGYGHWMIEDRATGAPLGWAGFAHSDAMPEPELGCTVFDGAEGQGIAFEACTAACQSGARDLGIPRPVGRVATWNTRSIALAERLGGTREGTEDGPHGAQHVYRFESAEAQA